MGDDAATLARQRALVGKRAARGLDIPATLLVPDIVEAILDGQQPAGIRLAGSM